MATMKHPLRRVDINHITALVAGLLCGASLVFGVNTLHPLTHQPAPPVIVLPAPSGSDGVIGGRLGGITSADTAVDAEIRAGLAPAAGNYDLPRTDELTFYHQQWLIQQGAATGGRLGGQQSSDTANDGAIRAGLNGSTMIPDPGQPPVVEEIRERIEGAAASGQGTGQQTVPVIGQQKPW